MGLLSSLREEVVDIIQWLDHTRDTLVWRFPRIRNEIKNGPLPVLPDAERDRLTGTGHRQPRHHVARLPRCRKALTAVLLQVGAERLELDRRRRSA